MKIFKKSTAAIISFMCMIVIAGYINYEYNEEREANLGRSVYVISKEGEVINSSNNENVSKNEEYFFSLNKDDYSKVKEKLKELKVDLNGIDIDSIKTSYDFDTNKYVIKLPKALEVKDGKIKELIEKYISLDKVVVMYE